MTRDARLARLMERYRSTYGEGGRDQQLDEVDRLFAGVDSDQTPMAAMIAGFARLERFRLTGARPDLDAGIAAIAGVIDQVAGRVAFWAEIGADLVNAYAQRSGLDGDPDDCDRGIATGRRLLAHAAPDGIDRLLLRAALCTVHRARWPLYGDETDLDEAVGHARSLVEAGVDSFRWAYGDLLRGRAETRRDLGDLDEAVRLIAGVVAEAPDGPDAYARHRDLGLAHHARWQLAAAPEDLAEARRCFDRAVRTGTPDDDAVIALHLRRLMIGHDLVALDDAAPAAHLRAYRAAHDDAYHAIVAARAARGPERSRLAAYAAVEYFWASRLALADPSVDRIEALVAVAREWVDRPALVSDAMAQVESVMQYFDAQSRGVRGADSGVTPLIPLATRAEPVPDAEAMLWTANIGRAIGNHDIRGIRAAATDLADAPDRPVTPGRPDIREVASIIDSLSGLRMDDAGALDELARRLAAFRGDGDDPELSIIDDLIRFVGDMSATAQGGPERTPTAPTSRAGSTGFSAGMDLVRAAMDSAGHFGRAMARHDTEGARRHAWAVDDLVDRAGPSDFARTYLTPISAQLLAVLSTADRGDVRARRAAIARYEEALAAAGGPAEPHWARHSMGLAELRRLDGGPGRAEGRAIGRSALAGHRWQVSMQTGSDYAMEAARRAADDAYLVASWCVADGAYDDLVDVLDAGRGLTLRSVVTSRDVADQLDAAGRADLADEWRATSGLGRDLLTHAPLGSVVGVAEMPDELRQRAFRALGADLEPENRVPSVREGLAAVGADALVYLVPGADGYRGYAAVVPADGPVGVIPLPGLVAGPESIVARYTGRYRTRDLESDEPAADPGVSLDDVCQWAWTAAVRDLVGYAARLGRDRPVRLVLVPMGPLAAVPWHAAYALAGAGRRYYGVTDLAFSYAVSAHAFRASAGHPVEASRVALVVGDPTGDLAYAGIEARAVYERFYRPIGTYFGQPAGAATAAGTPAEVLDWIAAAGPGPSTLHFACHGRIDPTRPADAHLVLAGHQHLTARDILDACRSAALDVDRVFLAACTTTATGVTHDEAFSLASVFLGAGARTVYGSLWPVPDTYTSVLMFVLHHQLNAGRLDPAAALHAAQRWMLDPNREPVPGMPPTLAASARDPGLADPVAWAAFTHMGR